MDAVKWSVLWGDEPAIQVQIRNILADIAATLRTALGDTTSPADYLPKERKKRINTEAINYFSKYGTVSTDGLKHRN